MSLIRIAIASPTSAPSTATGRQTSCPPRIAGVIIGPQQPGAGFHTMWPPSATGPSISTSGPSRPSVNVSTKTVGCAVVWSWIGHGVLLGSAAGDGSRRATSSRWARAARTGHARPPRWAGGAQGGGEPGSVSRSRARGRRRWRRRPGRRSAAARRRAGTARAQTHAHLHAVSSSRHDDDTAAAPHRAVRGRGDRPRLHGDDVGLQHRHPRRRALNAAVIHRAIELGRDADRHRRRVRAVHERGGRRRARSPGAATRSCSRPRSGSWWRTSRRSRSARDGTPEHVREGDRRRRCAGCRPTTSTSTSCTASTRRCRSRRRGARWPRSSPPARRARSGCPRRPSSSSTRAHAIHPVASVQSELSVWTRDRLDDVLPWCREHGVAFIPFAPLGRGYLTGTITAASFDDRDFRARNPRFTRDALQANLAIVERVRAVAERLGATPAQVALAWVLAQDELVVPIPGTTKVERVEENAGAAFVALERRRPGGARRGAADRRRPLLSRARRHPAPRGRARRPLARVPGDGARRRGRRGFDSIWVGDHLLYRGDGGRARRRGRRGRCCRRSPR